MSALLRTCSASCIALTELWLLLSLRQAAQGAGAAHLEEAAGGEELGGVGLLALAPGARGAFLCGLAFDSGAERIDC
ncbi:hypothetical protein CKO23_01705 [Thiocystis violacea]|nr:hypothetical protein [Thiocystis violacea]